MSPSLIDKLPDALKTLRTRPLFVMRLESASCRLSVPRRADTVALVWCQADRSRGSDFQARCWMGAATGRPYAPMAPRH